MLTGSMGSIADEASMVDGMLPPLVSKASTNSISATMAGTGGNRARGYQHGQVSGSSGCWSVWYAGEHGTNMINATSTTGACCNS